LVRDKNELHFLLELSRDDDEMENGSDAQLLKINKEISEKNIDKSLAELMITAHEKFKLELSSIKKILPKSEWYSSAKNFPKDSRFVVRTASLRKFLDGVNEIPVGADKPMTTTERNTLLIMIAALCKKAGVDPRARTAASVIERLVDDIDVSVSSETIRKALNQIPDALGARSK
jgi:hypothetical protein